MGNEVPIILFYTNAVVRMSEDHDEPVMLNVVSVYGMDFRVKFSDEKPNLCDQWRG